jgi:hypothetical protein
VSRIDVVYAANMKPGDLYAGQWVPDAPTTKVQTWAAAHKLTEVTPYTTEDGRRMVRLKTAGWEVTPAPFGAQCLVIRP